MGRPSTTEARPTTTTTSIAGVNSDCVDNFLEKLEHVQPSGANEWTARCPSHEDRTSSLSVGVGDDDRVLVNCFAGCTAEQIAAAVGLEIKDLFPARESNTARAQAPRVKPKPKAFKARPLTDTELENAKRKLSPVKSGSKAFAELEARGLAFGPLTAYQIGDDLILEIRGPDGKIWNHKRRHYSETLERRYSYLTLGLGAPAWCSPNYGFRKSVLIAEGELNAAAAQVAFTRAENFDWDVQGVAGAGAMPHAKGIKGHDVYIYADDDDPGRKAIDKWAEFALEHGAASVRVLEPLPYPDDFCDTNMALDGWLSEAIGTAKIYEKSIVPTGKNPLKSHALPGLINASTLMEMVFQPPRFAVPEVIPEGLVVLAGRPKLGKSWLVLGIAIAVAAGGKALGKIDVQRGKVLYCGLEDSPRRLQNRLEQVLGDAPPPKGLDFTTALKKLDDGGLEQITAWLDANPEARLVIIDTFVRVRGKDRGSNGYNDDSNATAPLQRLATDRGIAIVIVHHTRKADAEDVFDTINATTGLTGIVDAALILERPRNGQEATLHVTGRDIEEREIPVRFDPVTGQWHITDGAAKVIVSPERQAVLKLLKSGPLEPKEIAKSLERDSGATRKLILGMKNSGLVVRLESGKYTLFNKDVTDVTAQSQPGNTALVTPKESSGTLKTPAVTGVTVNPDQDSQLFIEEEF